MNSQQTKIGFIGAGNMAQAILSGLLEENWNSSQFIACDPAEVSQQKMKALNVSLAEDNATLVEQADIIVLAVKPQMVLKVLEPLTDLLSQQKPLIISIAAGVTIESLQKLSGGDCAVVRCMPNTPSLLRLGATGMYASEKVSDAQLAIAESIMQAVGLAFWVDDESLLDAVTAVSGSGPAYFFLLIEAMQKVGEELGLSQAVSRDLVIQTAIGAAHMTKESDLDAQQLRRNVTSPNGTTEAAINDFKNNNFEAVVQSALTKAFKRSQELAQEITS